MPRWHPPSLPPNPRLIRGTLLSCFSSQLRNGCWPRTSTPQREWGRELADPVMAAARVKELARAWALARRVRRAGKAVLLEDRRDPVVPPLKGAHREVAAEPTREVLQTPQKEWGRELADPVMAAARVKELARAWALARRNLQAAPRVKRRVALVEHRVARAVLCLAVRHQEEAAWCQR